MYRKILVTGGTGTLGTALRLISDEHPGREFLFLSSKDCDLRKQLDVVALIQKFKPDAILNLAAVVGGITLSTKHPATLLRDNVLMCLNILEASRVCGVGKVVMALSSGMYPSNCPNPIKEEYIHNGEPHPSNYSYSFAKRLVEPLVRAYRTEFEMNVIGLIPNGIIGENNNYNTEAATMPAALLRRFYENRNNDSKIVIWGDGSPLRELTYGKDMARTFMWCLDNYNEAQVLNVGTTEEVSVKDYALMIAEILGVDKGRIVFDTSKPAGQLRKSTDTSKFMALSKFQYTPLRKALEHIVHDFCENYDKPGKMRL